MIMEKSETPNTLEEIIYAWKAREPNTWGNNADRFLQFGKKAIKYGHPSLSFDILKEGLALFPEHIDLMYWAALALARGGSTRSAANLLGRLLERIDQKSPVYADTLSLAGRIAKDRYTKLPEGKERRESAEKSTAYYQRAFETSYDYFPGINAASMTMLAGKTNEAKEVARRVYNICMDQKHAIPTDDYWFRATVGEACLLLDRQEEAAGWYREAVLLAHDRYGDIATMRRQIKMLSMHIEVHEPIFKALDIPKVVAFTGHMIDTPERHPPRFPSIIEGVVKDEIATTLRRINAGFGYSSAACGADILFIEAMLEREAEVHILIPFRKEDFIQTSVAFAGEHWVKRFEYVMSRATNVHYATEEGYLHDDILFQYTGDLIQGMALFRAGHLEVEPVMIALMDSAAPSKIGGTVDNVQAWQRQGRGAEIVDLETIRRKFHGKSVAVEKPAVSVNTLSQSKHERGGRKIQIARQIKAMLFADVVGFSKLGEENAPSFFVDFLGRVANVIAINKTKPDFCNTWGDGLFLVFDEISAAADFSLSLRDMVLNTDWKTLGLPEDTNVRIGMHAGPVFEAEDPILQQNNYYGTHVNQAARIEPITAAGAVFMSEQFSCLLMASGNPDFACDYLGTVELAKKFGSNVLYRLRRADETE